VQEEEIKEGENSVTVMQKIQEKRNIASKKDFIEFLF
jgi:hypothetical protein